MKFKILTLFPEMFPGPINHSITGKALRKKKFQLEAINIRDFSTNKAKTVDDTPFGGGAGMIMKPDMKALTKDLLTTIILRKSQLEIMFFQVVK